MSDAHGGRDLASKVDHVGRVSPALRRHLAGVGPMLRNATVGTREWGLLTVAS